MDPLNWLIALAQTDQGVQSVVKSNQYGRSFFTLYGNTFAIKDKLKNMGFKFFKGMWSIPVDMLNENIKTELTGIGVDLSVLDVVIDPPQPIVPQEKTEVTPTAEQSEVDKELNRMKAGVEMAMKETGSERVKSLLGFVDRMIERVAQMTDDAAQSDFVKSFLSFASKFHGYSFHNQILIWVQKPDASYVKGPKQWMELGREVTNWDKGISIVVPMFKKIDVPVDTANTDPSTQEKMKKMFFGSGKVYDISDTQPIPNFEKMKGKKPFEPVTWRQDANENVEEMTVIVNALVDWAKSKNIDVDYEAMNEQQGGFSAGGKIRVNDKYQGINLFSTMVHETAHEILHWEGSERKGEAREWSRQQKEIDAETAAYIVLQHYGFETKDTPNYLALWKAKGEDVKERRVSISKAVKEIIAGIESKMKEAKLEEPTEEVVAKSKKTIKLSKSQWQFIGKKTGWIK